ncbi:MAG TPA: hypothetical protein VK477_14960 [Acidobacteriota bacterium]|nr:hypothetical protein [Acidobacteriota bacterium]
MTSGTGGGRGGRVCWGTMNDSATVSSLPNTPTRDNRRGRLVAGGVLLAVACAALAAPYLPPGLTGRAFLPFLGVAFVVWAALSRSAGLLVPGGVLLGVGVGAWLQASYGSPAFFFSLAGGFLSISVLSLLIFGAKTKTWWTVFPAGGLVFAGIVVSGGPAARETLRAMHGYWPFALIAVAIALIVSALRTPKT